MSERRNGPNLGGQWQLVIATAVLLLGMLGGFWSLANPKEDLKELKAELVKFKDEVRWVYTNKDENKTYREGLERIIGRIEVKADRLDTDIRSVGIKDLLAQLQNRVIELERSVRDSKKPDVQIGPQIGVRP